MFRGLSKQMRFILYAFIAILIIADPVFPEIRRIEIPSSPNPVGSGARALGMGGAFIAVADDATAASWNPGGLIQLELPEISYAGNFFHRIEDNTFGISPGAGGDQTVSEIRLNYFSAACPFELWGRNMIVSLNYQHLYDFNREWDFRIAVNSQGLSKNQTIHYRQEGGLSALGIAWCIQVMPRFSFGVTLNLWDNGLTENEWEQKLSLEGTGAYAGGNLSSFEARSTDRYSFSGFNMNFGFLWGITEKFSIGAVLKTPFEADIDHDQASYDIQPGSDSPESRSLHENAAMDMPMSYGIGMAYRFSREFTASADICRTEWDDFVLRNSEGDKTSPVTGGSPGDIDPTHQVRIGAEYLFITSKYVIPLRGGIFYDPAPAEGSPDDYFGFSIGSGIGYKQVIFDIAYQCRFGKNVGAYILKSWEFSQDMEEHMFYSSVIVHF
ncbi:outer membrane protein transport protein [Desulfococcaceae bacterium HSG8]|nr:outer membrane protein transport protein [Desulfococcaceae bacterium HSG8]